MFVDEAAAGMRSRDQLEHSGLSTRAITQAVRDGALHRVDHGWYVDAAAWRAWYPEQRHLLRVVAAHRRRAAASGAVFSHCSAAVLWKLPLARLQPRRVHVSGSRANGHVRGGDPTVGRHEVAVPAEDVAVVGGIPCTSLARTVADAIRDVPEEAGIAIMDAALRMVAWSERTRSYDERAAAWFAGEVARRLPRGGRGVRRGRFILEIGDGRAQLPGESISRLYLLRLGFARPRLQVPVAAPDGGWYFVDFGLDDADAWGEFDGRGKYLDESVRGADVDIEGAVLAEKAREDWIRGTTDRRFARWGSEHILDPSTLRTRLLSFAIRPR